MLAETVSVGFLWDLVWEHTVQRGFARYCGHLKALLLQKHFKRTPGVESFLSHRLSEFRVSAGVARPFQEKQISPGQSPTYSDGPLTPLWNEVDCSLFQLITEEITIEGSRSHQALVSIQPLASKGCRLPSCLPQNTHWMLPGTHEIGGRPQPPSGWLPSYHSPVFKGPFQYMLYSVFSAFCRG